MTRYFNNKEIELLAPVGNFEIFKNVIKTPVDAVYLGGKLFNMRMHRKDFNFTDNELEEAVKLAHYLGKKIYVTVNNLLSYEDLEQLNDYLIFLEKIKIDAIIIQDLAILDIIKNLNLNINIHSSVMMNVHNFETVKVLENLGVERAVVSRDIDLNTVKQFSCKSKMEFEYFVHGDMCVAHGAQCNYSGMLFGKSGSRGLCMKPCRWSYKINKDNKQYDTTFPLAVKDMYMYENIPELIEAGVVSFKIEGRMREAEYLSDLIKYYSDAIDRYIDDPINYDRKKYSKELYKNRKRDFSTAYAFGNQGLKNINERYEGTGKFYSTGKVFSKPVEEIESENTRINELKEILKIDKENINSNIKLSIKVNSYSAAKIAIEEAVEKIYLSGDVYEPYKPFSKEEILNLTKNKKTSKIYMCLPRMMFDDDFSKYSHLLKSNNLNLDGIVATNIGAINRFKDLDLEIVGDYSLNIYNHLAADFYKNQGISLGVLSCESTAKNTKEILLNSNLDLEVIVHGNPSIMYMSHDLYQNTDMLEGSTPVKRKFRDKNALILLDNKGIEHPVYKDVTGKNHMILAKDLNYMPILKELAILGAKVFRIDGCTYNDEVLREIIKKYKQAIKNLDNCNEISKKFSYKCVGFTLGAMQFD